MTSTPARVGGRRRWLSRRHTTAPICILEVQILRDPPQPPGNGEAADRNRPPQTRRTPTCRDEALSPRRSLRCGKSGRRSRIASPSGPNHTHAHRSSYLLRYADSNLGPLHIRCSGRRGRGFKSRHPDSQVSDRRPCPRNRPGPFASVVRCLECYGLGRYGMAGTTVSGEPKVSVPRPRPRPIGTRAPSGAARRTSGSDRPR